MVPKPSPWPFVVSLVLLLTAGVSCRPEPPASLPDLANTVADGWPPQDAAGEIERLDPADQIVMYWHPYTGLQEEGLLGLVDEFNRTNGANITVQVESSGSSAALHRAMLDAISSRKLPDLILAPPYQAATYAMHGVLVDLEPYIASERWGYLPKEMADFLPQALASGDSSPSGARYSWPFYQTMEVMYYNEDWLTELGAANPPATWEQFAGLACMATVHPFSGITSDRPSYGYVYSLDPLWFAALVASRGGQIVSEDGSTYLFNGPAGLEALLSLREWRVRGCAQEQVGQNGNLADFGVGRVLFDISPAHHLSSYVEAVKDGAGFQWGVAPLPHATAGLRVPLDGMGHSIVVGRPEEQLAAWVFVKWLSEPTQQARWVRSTGYFPVRSGAVNLLADYIAGLPRYGQAFRWLMAASRAETLPAGYEECQVVIHAMLTAVMRGEDPQTQLDAAVQECNRHLPPSSP